MEKESQNDPSTNLQSGFSVNTNNPPDPAKQVPVDQQMSHVPQQRQQTMLGNQANSLISLVQQCSEQLQSVKGMLEHRKKRQRLEETNQQMTMQQVQSQQPLWQQRRQGGGAKSQMQNNPSSLPGMFRSSQTVPVSNSQLLQPNIRLVQPCSSMLQRQQIKQQQEQLQRLLQCRRQEQAMQTHQLMQQHVRMPPSLIYDTNYRRMRQGINVQPGLRKQHLSSNKYYRSPLQQPNPVGPQMIRPKFPATEFQQQRMIHPINNMNYPLQQPHFSPLQQPNPIGPQMILPNVPTTKFHQQRMIHPSNNVNYPLQQPYFSPLDQQPRPNVAQLHTSSPLLSRTGYPSQLHGLPIFSPSFITFVPSPMPGFHQESSSPLPELSSQLGTCGNIQATLLPVENHSSASSKSLAESVGAVGSAASMMDGIVGSAPGEGLRAPAGEDFAATAKRLLQQVRNRITREGTSGVSDNHNWSWNQDSPASSRVQRLKIEPKEALKKEINDVNNRLIDVVVEICDEVATPSVKAAAGGIEGKFVRCSYAAVSLSPEFKALYTSGKISQIQPLHLLVPENYPDCSPIFLDKFPFNDSEKTENLSMKTNSKFWRSMRIFPEPMSLKNIAQTWDDCARVALLEFAEKSGGGTFSSKYGKWVTWSGSS